MTFEMHKRVIDDKVMEFYAEVRHVGSSSRFRLPGPSTDPAPSHVLALEDVVMRDYNSGEDSDYEEESSCHSMEEDEKVPNTPAGCPQLVLPAQLSLWWWVTGNREVVFMVVKNYSIRRNVEYKVVESNRLKNYWQQFKCLYDRIWDIGRFERKVRRTLVWPRHGGRSLFARQHIK
ncbi:hypothetical protein PIB30_096797 [Stylosanthes scabra]|uniref:Uncharacterized protein n=1 Tax=Stylosanthes scabra TaxID=79078 RepID=A0ABU6RX00_9FABA|nr:hypothetical protein [Stylosanthes scabra]